MNLNLCRLAKKRQKSRARPAKAAALFMQNWLKIKMSANLAKKRAAAKKGRWGRDSGLYYW